MRRRHAVVTTGLVVLLGVGIALGGAAVSTAGPRLIDPFTVTASPTPAQLGRHVAFTVFFKNASGHTLNQATLTSIGSAGSSFDAYTSSRGTCAVDANNSAKVTCTYGHLEAGAEVTTTFRYNTPSTGSSMSLDSTLTVDEGGGDPGSQSIFHPSPNPTVVNLEAQSTNKLDDVFDTTGGSNATAPVALGNPTSTRLTTPATGAFEPIVISEGAVDPNTCGSGQTALYATSTVSAPGTFLTTPLTVVLDLDASGFGQLSDAFGCHNGFTLTYPCPAVIPAQGCLQNREKVKNELGVNVVRLTMVAPSNGLWGGGH
jgi:Domain of unknown function DUF11